MKIVIDAMGGDLAPNEIVLGALDALREEKDFSVVLVGDVDKVNPILAAENTTRKESSSSTQRTSSPTTKVLRWR